MTRFRHPDLVTDPLDMEVEPGVSIRDLRTVEECNAALFRLEQDIGVIVGQIARHEANPESRPPDWRTSAAGAIRWKKRTAKAVRLYATTLAGVANADVTTRKHRLLLDTIRTEIGDDEFDRIVAVAKRRHPVLFGEEG